MSQHPSLHQFQNEIFVLPLKTLIFPSFYCILWKITTEYECISKSYKLEWLQILLFIVSLTCKFCNIPWFLVHPWQNSINFHLEQKTVMLSEEDIQHSTAQHGFPLQWKKKYMYSKFDLLVHVHVCGVLHRKRSIKKPWDKVYIFQNWLHISCV